MHANSTHVRLQDNTSSEDDEYHYIEEEGDDEYQYIEEEEDDHGLLFADDREVCVTSDIRCMHSCCHGNFRLLYKCI